MFSFQLIGLPGQCKDIVASEVTKDSCKISWQPPDSDGGTPILHYVLERREAVKKTFMPVMSGENKVSWVVKDLLINGEYYFRVKAVNKIGGGEYLEIRNPVITEEQKRKCIQAYKSMGSSIKHIFLNDFAESLYNCYILRYLYICIFQSGQIHQLMLKLTIQPISL